MNINTDEMHESRVLPNGVDVIAVVNANIVHNLLRDGASHIELLSTWRLAKCVVTEATPLLVYSSPLR